MSVSIMICVELLLVFYSSITSIRAGAVVKLCGAARV